MLLLWKQSRAHSPFDDTSLHISCAQKNTEQMERVAYIFHIRHNLGMINDSLEIKYDTVRRMCKQSQGDKRKMSQRTLGNADENEQLANAGKMSHSRMVGGLKG